jgi:small subunit ribosomal protein S29
MAQQPCVRCLARSSGLPLSLNLAIRTRNVPSVINGSHSAPFSTTTSLAQPAPKQKIGGGLGGKAGPPKRGDKLTFKIKKKKIVEQKGRPPAPGERKAQRKRIVLSNTNALEVPGMDNYTAETMIQPELLGKVVGVEGEMVDKLRAAEAFRVSQAWGLFRRPGMLIRDVTWKMAQELERMSNKENKDTIRRVIIGELGSGKSVHLLQAMTMAFLKEWVVITIPEGMLHSSRAMLYY